VGASNSKHSDNAQLQKTRNRLSDRIRKLRKACGYSSAEAFANAHNINRTQYGRYERGAEITFTTLVRLIEALGVSVAEFFSEGFD
jgi:transcriptional regulator with XRE-family HTH domain